MQLKNIKRDKEKYFKTSKPHGKLVRRQKT